jgi:hypothetical protein
MDLLGNGNSGLSANMANWGGRGGFGRGRGGNNRGRSQGGWRRGNNNNTGRPGGVGRGLVALLAEVEPAVTTPRSSAKSASSLGTPQIGAGTGLRRIMF